MTANFTHLRQRPSALVESWIRRLDICAPNSPEARAVFAEADRDGLVDALRGRCCWRPPLPGAKPDLLEALREPPSPRVEGWVRRLDCCEPDSLEARAIFAEAAKAGLADALTGALRAEYENTARLIEQVRPVMEDARYDAR